MKTTHRACLVSSLLPALLGGAPSCVESGVKPVADSDADGDSALPVDTGEPTPDDCDGNLLGAFLAVTAPAGPALLAFTAWDRPDDGFDYPFPVDTGAGERASTMLIGDFNGDGAADMLARGESSAHLYLLEWDPCTISWSASDLGAVSVHLEAVADLNGDGALDVIGISHDRRTAEVLLGLGDGRFDATPGAIDLSGVYSGHEVTVSGHAADVSGDGVPDLVLADYDHADAEESRLWLATGAGDGRFEAPTLVATVPTAVNGLDLVDLNLDGHPEVLAGLDDDGDAGALYLGRGTSGGFESLNELADLNPAAESGANNPGMGRVFAVDWDGDGAPDPIVSYQEDPTAADSTSLHLMTGLSDLSPDSVRELTEIGTVATINFAVPLQD